MSKDQNQRLEHFESYSSFSYCTHSSVYLIFWPNDWVVDCIHFDFIQTLDYKVLYLAESMKNTADAFHPLDHVKTSFFGGVRAHEVLASIAQEHY